MNLRGPAPARLRVIVSVFIDGRKVGKFFFLILKNHAGPTNMKLLLYMAKVITLGLL